MTKPKIKTSVFLILANRCEREVPSRELEQEIHAAVTGYPVTFMTSLPHYTTRLDAARKLVPKNLETTEVFYWHKQKLWQATMWTNNSLYRGCAKTESRARCAAALRARAGNAEDTL